MSEFKNLTHLERCLAHGEPVSALIISGDDSLPARSVLGEAQVRRRIETPGCYVAM